VSGWLHHTRESNVLLDIGFEQVQQRTGKARLIFGL
jgi:hypothetical protein